MFSETSNHTCMTRSRTQTGAANAVVASCQFVAPSYVKNSTKDGGFAFSQVQTQLVGAIQVDWKHHGRREGAHRS